MSMDIGLALYSIRGELEKDYFGVLEQVAKIGYKHVELIGHSISDELKETVTPQLIGAKLKEFGLTAISSHVPPMPDANWDEIIESHLIMGCQGIVIPFGFLGTEEQVNQTAGLCNTIGKKCRENGLDFYYHNHFQEFVKVNGVYGLDLLMERTDPEYVSVELDTYWAVRGGVDPLEEMERLGDRLKILHQKDLSKDASPVNLFDVITDELTQETMMKLMRDGTSAKPTDIVEVGTGIMDIKAICEKAKTMPGIKSIIVELDHIYNMPPMDSIRVSLENLQKLV